MTTYLHGAISRFAWMDAPLIAAVNGVAAGGGLSLVACCDLAISAEHARYTSAYTQIGLSPDCSSSYYLSRLEGLEPAMPGPKPQKSTARQPEGRSERARGVLCQKESRGTKAITSVVLVSSSAVQKVFRPTMGM